MIIFRGNILNYTIQGLNMLQLKCLLLLAMLLLISPPLLAKKRCKALLEKLHNVQALQRNGYSSKQGNSLRVREDKARDKWWQCEKGHTKQKKKSGNKKSSTTINKKKTKSKKIKAGTPFKTQNAIVIQSKYQGNKKHAWLKFYQQPKRCQRPKSLSEFAFCSEDKQAQRLNFEKSYIQ